MNYWIIAAAVAGVLLVIVMAVVFTRRYIRNFTDKRIAEYQNDLITKHCEEVQNIYKTIIPRNVRLAEAPSYGQPITLYDTKSAGAEAYRLLAEEVINREDE